MKKIFRILVIVIALITVSYFSYRIINRIQENEKMAEKRATIPQFSFVSTQNKPFTKQNISDTLGSIIMELFSPDCEHCQYMAKTMVKNKEKFQDIEILMVTPFGDSSKVTEFAQAYQLNALPNVHILLDPKMEFPKIFGSALVPSFYIYKQNRLVKSINGETKIENLLE